MVVGRGGTVFLFKGYGVGGNPLDISVLDNVWHYCKGCGDSTVAILIYMHLIYYRIGQKHFVCFQIHLLLRGDIITGYIGKKHIIIFVWQIIFAHIHCSIVVAVVA